MADFNIAYRIVHGNEGGYANHAADKGGETYMGIARNSHPQWGGWVLIDAYKAAHGPIPWNTFLKIPALGPLVASFYKASFLGMKGDLIKSQEVANFYYDFYTNSGGATKVVQRLLINAFKKDIPLDGLPGRLTATAINEVDPIVFHNSLKAARKAYVTQLAVNDPTQQQFLPEWLRRIGRFPDLQKKKLVLA